MQIGVLVQNFAGFPETGRSARACVEVAVAAERLGYDAAWVTDHVVLPEHRQARYPHNDSGEFPYRWDQDIHEPLTLLAALAQATDRVELGTAVLVIPYRHPLLAAKMLATVDQLSAGRVILGAGVGWLRDEFDALGLAPEIFEHRGSVTEDYLRAMQAAWTATGPASHHGRFARFEGIGTRPVPARPRHPPVWVGGKGDRALRRAVRLGQGYLGIASAPGELAAEVDRLGVLAREHDRDPTELTVALIEGIALTDAPMPGDRPPLHGTPGQIAEGLDAYRRAGLDHLVAGIRTAGDPTLAGAVAAMETLAATVLPEVKGPVAS